MQSSAAIFSSASERGFEPPCEQLASVRVNLSYEPLFSRNGDGRSHYACEPWSAPVVKAKHGKLQYALPSSEPGWSHESDVLMSFGGFDLCEGHAMLEHEYARRHGLSLAPRA